jgi:glycosyltransferase involved in cell wall biosynthesis
VSEPRPTVSIGLPVYNGEHFLRGALDSLLAQRFADFELIISDNASTDTTGAICAEYAARDPRVRYTHLPQNIGGVANHNHVRELARGEFFMWASNDDLWHPDYVQACVEVLRKDPQVVVAYTRNSIIDADGRHVRDVTPGPPLDADDVVERFRHLVDIYRAIEPFYGVIRLDVLRRTRLMCGHPGFDRILFAELGLMGKLRQVPQNLYLRRQHEKQSVGAYPSLRSRYRWVDPSKRRRFVMPHFEYLLWFASAALKFAPGFTAKRRCLGFLAKWCYWHHDELLGDLSLRPS